MRAFLNAEAADWLAGSVLLFAIGALLVVLP
jgi:hypothetical protein